MERITEKTDTLYNKVTIGITNPGYKTVIAPTNDLKAK